MACTAPQACHAEPRKVRASCGMVAVARTVWLLLVWRVWRGVAAAGARVAWCVWRGVVRQVPGGFWGYDSVAPGGICRRSYQALRVPPRAWAGLLKTPDVSASSDMHEAQRRLVGLIRR